MKSISDKTYEKIKREFDNFIADIKTKTPDEIVEAAYEITYKQEILFMFECEGAFSDKQSKAVLKMKNALDQLYQDWLDYDGSVVVTLNESVKLALSKEIERSKAKQHIDRESR